MHILRKILRKLCVGTCLLEPNVATPLATWSHLSNNKKDSSVPPYPDQCLKDHKSLIPHKFFICQKWITEISCK